MAAPILSVASRLAKERARGIFRNAKGAFVSRAKFELERRRLPSGRFGSTGQAAFGRRMEAHLRAELGAPPAGKQWHVIASKYPDRFEDYISEFR